MLEFVLDCLKTEKMCKTLVKKLLFVKMYFPDRYKSQEIGNKVFLENNIMLSFFPNCYKN